MALGCQQKVIIACHKIFVGMLKIYQQLLID